ncbi:MAG: phosphoribosylaminoimidazolesuccinocarboxamide synthase [Candidatus Thermoplasmatota archaeon]|nr:phosphoribosylaminoimidazolesuccinocarboxamide synthase [Candidatus Thermoplasmatota archaeon]
MDVVTETNLPLKIFKKGKVRDLYEFNKFLLLIATDRISAFDYVLKDPIPYKGICLTQISKFWFQYFSGIVSNQLISADVSSFPSELHDFKDILYARSMLVKKADVFPIECIVRGYISGSAWESYKKNGTVCGLKLPSGLREADEFEEPLFTPSTKASSGHDVNISFDQMKNIVGNKVAENLRKLSIKIYKKATEYAMKRGIIIADTKFEFGKIGDEIVLVDEALTPDSSRFWPVESYSPGRSQPSFDKQYLRDYLISTKWDKNSPPPRLPIDVIAETQRKYIDAYEKIIGRKFIFNSLEEKTLK